MSSKPNEKLLARVQKAVDALLKSRGHITYPLLLRELGILTPKDLAAWQAGQVPVLERVIQSNLTKLSRIQTAMRRIARERGLDRRTQQAPRGRRYSKTGHPYVEAEYGATWS